MIRYTAPRTSGERRQAGLVALALAAVALTAACSSSSGGSEPIPVSTAAGSDLIALSANNTAPAIETMYENGGAANIKVSVGTIVDEKTKRATNTTTVRLTNIGVDTHQDKKDAASYGPLGEIDLSFTSINPDDAATVTGVTITKKAFYGNKLENATSVTETQGSDGTWTVSKQISNADSKESTGQELDTMNSLLGVAQAAYHDLTNTGSTTQVIVVPSSPPA